MHIPVDKIDEKCKLPRGKKVYYKLTKQDFKKVVRQKIDLGLFNMFTDFEATLLSSEKRAPLEVPKSHFPAGCHGNIGIYLKVFWYFVIRVGGPTRAKTLHPRHLV